jgi:hypothetical protein
MILVDTHVHIYDYLYLEKFFDAAYANFKSAAKQHTPSYGPSFTLSVIFEVWQPLISHLIIAFLKPSWQLLDNPRMPYSPSVMCFLGLFFSALVNLAYAASEDKAYIWVISGAVDGLAVIAWTIDIEFSC